jgi:anaerobic selenocysteine-containing dehydrogenase
MGRLRRLRVEELAEEGSQAVLDHPVDLLQLRVGVRHPRVRRQGDARVRKIEGNPVHPGSRGRTCAKGVVTPNQLEDPDRVLYPLSAYRRARRGEWKRVTWDEALDELGARIREAMSKAASANDVSRRPARRGRLRNRVCRRGASTATTATPTSARRRRAGHFLWTGADRPSPDLRQRQDDPAAVVASRDPGTTSIRTRSASSRASRRRALIVIDPRLSNTSAKADLWLPANPGTEAALLARDRATTHRDRRYNRSSCGNG